MHILCYFVALGVIRFREVAGLKNVQIENDSFRTYDSTPRDSVANSSKEVYRAEDTLAWTEKPIALTEDYETYVRLDAERDNSESSSSVSVGAPTEEAKWVAVESTSTVLSKTDVVPVTPITSQEEPCSEITTTQSEQFTESSGAEANASMTEVILPPVSGNPEEATITEAIGPNGKGVRLPSGANQAESSSFTSGKLRKHMIPALLADEKLRKSLFSKLFTGRNLRKSRISERIATEGLEGSHSLTTSSPLVAEPSQDSSKASLTENEASTETEFLTSDPTSGGVGNSAPVLPLDQNSDSLASSSATTNEPELPTGAPKPSPALKDQTSTIRPVEVEVGVGAESATIGADGIADPDASGGVQSPKSSEVETSSLELSATSTNISTDASMPPRTDSQSKHFPEKTKRFFKIDRDIAREGALRRPFGLISSYNFKFMGDPLYFKRMVLQKAIHALRTPIRIKSIHFAKLWHLDTVREVGGVGQEISQPFTDKNVTQH